VACWKSTPSRGKKGTKGKGPDDEEEEEGGDGHRWSQEMSVSRDCMVRIDGYDANSHWGREGGKGVNLNF